MLLPEIDRFLRTDGMAATTFGRLAMNDPRFVHDLRRGRQPGRSAIERVRLFIAARRSIAANTIAMPGVRSRRH